MHVDQARQSSLANSLSMLYQEQFSGTWQAASSSNSGTSGTASSDSSSDSTTAPSPSTDVQLSQAGQQAASASQSSGQNGLASQISPEVDIFRSMMEQMLGTSITGMQFSGQLAEGSTVGVANSSGHHGHGNSSNSGGGNMYAAFGVALNLSGTITTADGRTLGFTASMTLLEAESWSGGTNAHASDPQSGNQTPSLPAPTAAPSTSSSGTPTSSTSGNSGVPSVNVPIPSATPTPTPAATPTASAPTPTPTASTPSTSPTPTPAPTSSTPAPTPTTGSSTGTGQNDWQGSLMQFEEGAIHFLLQLNQTLLQQMSDWFSTLNGGSSNSGGNVIENGSSSASPTPSATNNGTGLGSISTATDAQGTTSVTITDDNGTKALGTGTSLTNYTPAPAPSTKVGDTYGSSTTSNSPTPSAVNVSA